MKKTLTLAVFLLKLDTKELNIMKYIFPGLGVFVFLLTAMTSACCCAEVVIVPNYLATNEFSQGSGILDTVLRDQEVFDASQFPLGPILITQIAFRPNPAEGGPFTNTIANIQFSLSTSTNTHDHLSSMFANNVGANDTVVFSGALDISSQFTGPANGPKDFDMLIPLTTPFVYDSAGGNLLLDIRNFSGAPIAARVDMAEAFGGGADAGSRAYTLNPNATIASFLNSGVIALQVTYHAITNAAPVIYAQPTNRSALVGASEGFSVTAGGTPPLYYQWTLNSTNIVGATNTSLSLTNVQFTQAGNYSVRVTNNFGSVLSSNAFLNVFALIITNQPQSRVAAVGSNASFSLGVSSVLPISYQWWHGFSAIDGATNSILAFTNIQLNDAGEYFVVVTNSAGTVVSSNAVLNIYISAPQITTQPTSRTVSVGSSTTFSVVASGSPPLSYHWLFNGGEIPDATNTSLTLTNIQTAQAGNYCVSVTNLAGLATSTNAMLIVNPPAANVIVGSTNVIGGNAVAVPILLEGNGNENAISFSLNFSTTRLLYSGVMLGSGASGAALTVYTNGQVSLGRVGIVVSFPSGSTFAPGTQEVARVLFNSTVLLGSISNNVFLNFGDTPTVRQLTGSQSQNLPANYNSGTVIVQPTIYEADTSPRTTGSQTLTSNDWQQVGLFVARFNTANPGNELQRADCAPRSTLGDGQLKVADWVQAGRYVVGPDSPTISGGPTSEVAVAVSTGGPRTLRAIGGSVVQNIPLTIPIQLQSQGNENALAFSLAFDPAAFTYLSNNLGSAAPGATMNVNTTQIGSGKLGIALALPTGFAFPPGLREMATVTLLPTGSGVGTNAIVFADQPVPRSASDATANDLSVSYLDDSITVNPLPTLSISLSDTNAIVSWPDWASDFRLQMESLLTTDIWTNAITTLETNGGNINATVPASEDVKFFRLIHP